MKFHVGQRVRKVASRRKGELAGYAGGRHKPSPIGSLGVVTSSEATVPGDVPIKWDDREVETTVAPYMIEPIYDRPEAGSWDEICALTRGWRPGVVACG